MAKLFSTAFHDAAVVAAGAIGAGIVAAAGHRLGRTRADEEKAVAEAEQRFPAPLVGGVEGLEDDLHCCREARAGFSAHRRFRGRDAR